MTRTSQNKNDRGDVALGNMIWVALVIMAFFGGLLIGGSQYVQPSAVEVARDEPYDGEKDCKDFTDYDGNYLDRFAKLWVAADYWAGSCISLSEFRELRDEADEQGEAADQAVYDRKVAKAKAKIAAMSEDAGAVTMGARLNLALKYARKNQGSVAWDAASEYYRQNYKADPEMGWPESFNDAYKLRYPDEDRMPSAPQNWKKSSSPPTAKPQSDSADGEAR